MGVGTNAEKSGHHIFDPGGEKVIANSVQMCSASFVSICRNTMHFRGFDSCS